MFVVVLLLVFLTMPAWAEDKDWQKEWNQILQGAKKEGRVVVTGAANPELRQKLPAAFKKRFGIPVEYISARTSRLSAKLRIERRVKHYTIDVFFSGMTTAARILYPEKMIDPLRPLLILPDVVDPSKWKKGKLWFVDPEEKYILRLASFVSDLFYINTRYVKLEEFKSKEDFLDPKWKGKISVAAPYGGGPGKTTAAKLQVLFGDEFVKKLYVDQKPAITRNTRQQADWLALGKYPISLDADSEAVAKLQQDGFPIVGVHGLPGMPGTIGGANSHLSIANKAPHPNTARLFVNWIASREVLELFSRVTLYPTLRNDIDESFLSPERIPKPGMNYLDTSSWEFTLKNKAEIESLMRKLLQR